MAKIRYSEYFYSVQGEGKWVGTPSVFLRTFGCNLECNGFGQPRDNHMPIEDMPYMQIDVDNYSSVEELPVVDIGCDSSASWSKKYKKLSPFADTYDLAMELDGLLPGSTTFKEHVHLVITGGEPLLGWQKAYVEMFQYPQFDNLTHLTFETNGSKMVQPVLIDYFNNINNMETEVTWMVSPKLTLTGEDQEVTIQPDVLLAMNKVMNSYINLKFVIRDEEDIVEVQNAVQAYEDAGVYIESVFLMPEGATIEGQLLTEKNVADLCMEYGYKFSPRLHINLFGNSWGT
jgi:organic radical activating enzyme